MRTQKAISRNCRAFKFHLGLKRYLSKAAWNHRARVITCRTIEENEKKKHARLPAQMPASRVSRNPSGNYRQERMDAVSGLQDGNHRTDKSVGNTKKERNNPFKENQNAWHSNLKAPADTTCATLLTAIVKVTRA